MTVANRFDFNPETKPERPVVAADLRWLKSGDAIVRCGRPRLNGRLCHQEIAKVFKPRPVAIGLPLFAGRWLPLRPQRWWLTGPRGESGFDRAPDDVLIVRTGEPKLTRRPVPREVRGKRIIADDGRDEYGCSLGGRAATGYVACLGAEPRKVRCPGCGADNEVTQPERS